MLGNASTDNRNQLKQNQLRVTIKIPNEIYQELSWISVEVNKDVFIKCQVYLGDSNGNYTESTNKIIKGNSHLCDICVGPLGIKVGNNTHRYVRLVFSHTSITLLRNGIVSKIRGLALTKYKNLEIDITLVLLVIYMIMIIIWLLHFLTALLLMVR